MAPQDITVHHERNTDVLWVDFAPTPENAEVEVIDVGEDLGVVILWNGSRMNIA